MNTVAKTLTLSVLWIVIGGVATVVVDAGKFFLPHDMTLILVSMLGLVGLVATRMITQSRA